MGASGKGLPVTWLRGDSHGSRISVPAWQGVFPHLDATREPRLPDNGLQDQAAVWKLGDIVLTQASFAAVTFRRSLARIRADRRASLDFGVLTKGAWTGRAGTRALTVGPGEMVCLDFSRPFTINATAAECVVASVPRAALQKVVPIEDNLHGHVFDGVGAALLTDYCLSLSRHVGRMQPSEIPSVRGALLAQIEAAVNLIAALPQDVRPAVLRSQHAVRRHIDRHLTDEHLTADGIGQALNMSRSSLYRAFKDQGGIDAFIQKRRLQAVHALLRLPEEDRSIGELAEAFGFSRPSHLATAFRRTFGYSPARLRISARAKGVEVLERPGGPPGPSDIQQDPGEGTADVADRAIPRKATT